MKDLVLLYMIISPSEEKKYVKVLTIIDSCCIIILAW